MSEKIEIKPIKTKEYSVKQSKYDVCGKLPIRSVILGPSGSGKTVLLQNMILNLYKGCFERIYVFSPSVNHDTTWLSVKEYIEDVLDVHETDDEKFYFDHYNAEALERIIQNQTDLIKHMKSKNMKSLYSILIIIDDFADDPSFSRHSKLLHSLYTRGRHSMISTITATQKFNAIHPIIRVNATELYVYRLRNMKDLDTFIEEISATIPKKTLMQIYERCTAEPYSFLYVKLNAKSIHDMFYCNLTQKVKFT
jgi:DNA replication protein DnaC